MDYSQRKYGSASVNQNILDADPEYQAYAIQQLRDRADGLIRQKQEYAKITAGHEKSLREAERKFSEVEADGFEEGDAEFDSVQNELAKWRSIVKLHGTGPEGVIDLELANVQQAIADCERRLQKLRKRAENAAKRTKAEVPKK